MELLKDALPSPISPIIPDQLFKVLMLAPYPFYPIHFFCAVFVCKLKKNIFHTKLGCVVAGSKLTGFEQRKYRIAHYSGGVKCRPINEIALYVLAVPC